MTGEQLIALAIANRARDGLRLRFAIPDRTEPFVCYPKDEAQKAKWLANAARKGWALVQ